MTPAIGVHLSGLLVVRFVCRPIYLSQDSFFSVFAGTTLTVERRKLVRPSPSEVLVMVWDSVFGFGFGLGLGFGFLAWDFRVASLFRSGSGLAPRP